jgi:hypothetical protein
MIGSPTPSSIRMPAKETNATPTFDGDQGEVDMRPGAVLIT